MTVRRKVAKIPGRSNKTAFSRAIANKETKKRVMVLQRDWAALGLVQRGKQLLELAALGCSTRGLQEELGRSATSIRRHMEIAKLPEEEREAIDAGASAKKILAEKANAECRRRSQERILEDRKTGTLSDGLATIILEFCRAKGGPRRVPVAGGPAEQLLNEVRRALYLSDAHGGREIKVSKTKAKHGLFSKTRPPKRKDAFWFAYQADWLANVVWAKAPELPIWERAIKKAEQRIGELKPAPKKPLELWLDRKRQSITAEQSIPWRPMWKGAGVMPRQGKPAPAPKLR